MSFSTAQCTLDLRSAAPAPSMDMLTTWVVLTGPPASEAPRITAAEANCEVKPWIG